MTLLRIVLCRLLAAFRKKRLERELDEELRAHLEMLVEEKIRRGMAPEGARYAALRSFGGVEQAKEEYRDQRGLPMLETLAQDLRSGFSATVPEQGVRGGGHSHFGPRHRRQHGHLQRCVRRASEAAAVCEPGPTGQGFRSERGGGHPGAGCSYAEFLEWRRQNHVFSGMAAVQGHELTLTGRDEPMVVKVGDVTADFFSVLGVAPLTGRTFLPEDGEQGAAPVAVLSDGLWRSRFGADPDLIGRTIDLDKRSFTVVGVMPGNFRFSLDGRGGQLWIPMVQDPFFGPLTKGPGGHGGIYSPLLHG